MGKNITISNSNLSEHYYWLDALRFIAAFFVLLSHSRNDFFLPFNKLPLEQQGIITFVFYFVCRLGHEAVLVFFVISGFLVGGRGLERIKNNNFDAKSYTIDRTVRIGLPLLAAIAFCIVVYNITGIDYSWLTALGNLLSLQGILCDNLISPFWSLSYEVWFYIFLLGVAMVSNKKISGLYIIIVCGLVFTQLSSLYLLFWFIGAFAYLCRPSDGNKLILYISFAALIGFICLSIVASESNAISFSWKPDRKLIEVLICLSLCLFVQQIILLKPKFKFAIKTEKMFSKLADFSYTLYLTHRITLLLVFYYIFEKQNTQFDIPGFFSYIVVILLCVIVSWLIYLISEKHTKTVKKWIKSKLIAM